MSEMLSNSSESARKAFSSLMQASQDAGIGKQIAIGLQVSEATVSRAKNEKLDDAVALIYALGFKVVTADRICVERSKYEAVVTLARAAMSCDDTVKKLVWEGE